MQLQSIYDHVILSVCYDGEFNSRRGRVKISHRFNEAGRIDFVELKFLRSLVPSLTGEIRKLVTIKDYQHVHQDWLETEAHVLRVLPQELVFLYGNLFRCARADIIGWLINIGHRTVTDLVHELRAGRVNGCERETGGNPNQLRLATVNADEVALPILERAATLESTVEINDSESVGWTVSSKVGWRGLTRMSAPAGLPDSEPGRQQGDLDASLTSGEPISG